MPQKGELTYAVRIAAIAILLNISVSALVVGALVAGAIPPIVRVISLVLLLLFLGFLFMKLAALREEITQRLRRTKS